MTELIEKLKKEIIEQLNLEDIKPEEIESKEPLFGDGLGLDSIDALELIVLLEKEYGKKITDPAQGREILYSVDAMARFIQKDPE
jgi:acyl carrier protein